MNFVNVYFPSMEEATELWTPDLIRSANTMERRELAQIIIDKIHDVAPETTVVLKDGPNGIYGARQGEELVHDEAVDVPVVHRVGAGDAANAGFAAELIRGGTLKQCLTNANLIAARRISNGGLVLPTTPQVQQTTSSRL